jgi:NADPH-dependent 2,4-dienoyl-CoA reductase/sulfur reductase-like enzyme
LLEGIRWSAALSDSRLHHEDGDLTREKKEVFVAKKLVVVGGGAGGPSAAAKAKREAADLEVTIFEAGEHVSFAA